MASTRTPTGEVRVGALCLIDDVRKSSKIFGQDQERLLVNIANLVAMEIVRKMDTITPVAEIYKVPRPYSTPGARHSESAD